MGRSSNVSEFTFGQLLSRLLKMSRQKSYVLAGYLNYDVSYISKWVTGTMLPATRHANVMCREIANFIVNNTEDTVLADVKKFFEAEDTEDLKEEIYEALLNAYKESNKKDSKSKAALISADTNSKTIVNPRLQKLYIRIQPERAGDDYADFNIAMMSDLLSLGKEDKISIAQVDDGPEFSDHVGEIHYLFSLNKEKIDDDFDALLFTSMLNNYSDYNCTISDYYCVPCSILLAVQNYCIHTSIVSQNHRAILSNLCMDKAAANEMYDTIIANEKAFTKPMVYEKTMSELISDNNYLSFILSTNIQIYITHVDELLLPDNLFEELLNQIEIPANKKNEIRNLHMVFQSVLTSSDIKIAILDRCLHEYALNGVLDFYGNRIIVTPEQREKHLRNILTLLNRENTNIQLSLLDAAVLKEFEKGFSPCIYSSDYLTYIRIRKSQRNDKVNIIETNSLKDIYRRFLNKTFSQANSDNKSTIIKLSTYLNMLKILR